MTKDKRYKIIKTLLDAGQLVDFRDIFNYIPKKVVYQDLGMNYGRFKRLLAHPDLFSLRELSILSTFVGVEPRAIIELAFTQTEKDKKGRRKRG